MQAFISLPAHPRSSREARVFVRNTLQSWRLDELCAEAELLASELVTNVVLHVGTPLRLTLKWPATRRQPLRVEVSDASPRPPRRRSYADDASTGRGMVLVERIASRHGVEIDQEGKHVWFELAPRDQDGSG